MLITGHATANGPWGLVKVLAVVATATRTAHLVWHPLRPCGTQGVRQLYVFAWSAGFLFSFGNLITPALLAVQPYLPIIASVLTLAFIATTAFGGLVMFIVPTVLLQRMVQVAREHALDQLSPMLERLDVKISSLDLLPNA